MRNWEAGLLSVWRRHESKLSPEHVEIQDSEPLFRDDERSLLGDREEDELHDINDAQSSIASTKSAKSGQGSSKP